MSGQAREIIRELRLILSHLSQCILSVQQDIKNISCTSGNTNSILTSVTQKIELLQECISSVQRISRHLKACCTPNSQSVEDEPPPPADG